VIASRQHDGHGHVARPSQCGETSTVEAGCKLGDQTVIVKRRSDERSAIVLRTQLFQLSQIITLNC
jgi:hypothetical protein